MLGIYRNFLMKHCLKLFAFCFICNARIVDTSKALIWSASTPSGLPALTIFYGDPATYVPGLIWSGNADYSTDYVTYNNPGFGALDTSYQESKLYYYFSKNVYYSADLIPRNGGVRVSYYLHVVALSNKVFQPINLSNLKTNT